MIYRPVRERSMDRLMETGGKAGGGHGLRRDFADEPVQRRLFLPAGAGARDGANGSPRSACSISLPSQRIDNVLTDTLRETQKVRKTAPDAGPRGGHSAPARRHQQGRDRGRPDPLGDGRVRAGLVVGQALFHDRPAHGDGRGRAGHRRSGAEGAQRVISPCPRNSARRACASRSARRCSCRRTSRPSSGSAQLRLRHGGSPPAAAQERPAGR